MYDENGNLITTNTSDLDNQDDEDIETLDAHEDEDQDDDEETVTISKAELEKLKKQNEKLKNNKVKNIIKHKSQGNELLTKVQELEAKLNAQESQKEETEIKSMYAEADVEEVRKLTSKWLTVKQAVNALYAEELTSKKTSSNWFVVGRPAPASDPSKKTTPRGYELWDKRTQESWKTKNWF